MKFVISLLIFVILLLGCAWTKITSFKDPDFSNTNFSKILIIVPFSDLELRQTTEKEFQDALYSKGITAITSIELFPPTREFSPDEILNLLRKFNIDGILFIASEDYWTSPTYTPESRSTKGSASLIGNLISYSVSARKYRSNYLSKSHITFELRLYDVNTGRTAWIAKSNTRKNAFADFNRMMTSLAISTTNQLKKDGLINILYKSKKENKNFVENSRKIREAKHKYIKTRLPKLRAAVPEFNKYTDEEIIAAYRQKHPKYKNVTDEEIIIILEENYSKK